MKKKFCIYGNCQIYSLKACLQQSTEFNNYYEEIKLKPVFELSTTDISHLEQIVSEVDLFIHQPISNNYKGTKEFSTEYLRSLLKPTSKAISFPVAYFTGYHPELFYLKGENGQILDEPIPYHDANILNFYIKNFGVDDVLKTIQDSNFYSREHIEQNLDKTLSNLSVREENIDIQISQFIRENHKQTKLFHTINHPHISVISFIASEILNMLELPFNKLQCLEIQDIYRGGKTDYPIYPSVSSNLNLNFVSKFEYRIRKDCFTSKKLIETLFRFYDKNPSLVKKSKKRVSEVQGRQIINHQPQLNQSIMRVPSKVSALTFLRDNGLDVGTILDVGVRDKTEELIEVYPSAKHVLFEPVEEFQDRIKTNYEKINYDLIQAAVSNEDTKGFLEVRRKTKSGNITHSQVVKENTSNLSRIIQKITLDSFLESRDYQKPYLLKIDVDGHEMAVLRGAVKSLKEVSCVIIEAPLETLFDRLRFLTREGFILWDIVDFTYYKGNLYQVDLILLNQIQKDKKPFSPRKYSQTSIINKDDWENFNSTLGSLYSRLDMQ